MLFFLHITCSCIFHAFVSFLFYLLVLCCDGTFLFVSLSLSRIVCAWHPSANPLRLGTLFILGHLPLILLLFMFGSMMKRPVRTFRRTFPNVAFIRNAASFYQTFLILLYPLSFTVGDKNLCEIPVSCPTVIIQEFHSNMHNFDTSISRFVTQVRGTHIVVTSKIVSEILHILQVLHPNYPTCPRLRTMSNDELLSLFCETPSSWSERQNTSCSGFAKDPRFLNMVMTFVFHPLSYYNSITEPHSCFLLSLIKDHSIDFHFHFILSLIDVYRDKMTSDKLIFPSTITRIIRYSFIPYPESSHFIVISAISVASVR